MKHFKKLNPLGFAHWIVPAVVLVIVGAIGTYFVTASHAAVIPSLNAASCANRGRKWTRNSHTGKMVCMNEGVGTSKSCVNKNAVLQNGNPYNYCSNTGGASAGGSHATHLACNAAHRKFDSRSGVCLKQCDTKLWPKYKYGPYDTGATYDQCSTTLKGVHAPKTQYVNNSKVIIKLGGHALTEKDFTKHRHYYIGDQSWSNGAVKIYSRTWKICFDSSKHAGMNNGITLVDSCHPVKGGERICSQERGKKFTYGYHKDYYTGAKINDSMTYTDQKCIHLYLVSS